MRLTIRYKKKKKISPAVQERIEHKMERISKFLEVDHPVHLVLKTEKDGEHVEISLHYHGHDIISKGVGKNLFEAIDKSIAIANRQIEKVGHRIKNHKGEKSIRKGENSFVEETPKTGS